MSLWSFLAWSPSPAVLAMCCQGSAAKPESPTRLDGKCYDESNFHRDSAACSPAHGPVTSPKCAFAWDTVTDWSDNTRRLLPSFSGAAESHWKYKTGSTRHARQLSYTPVVKKKEACRKSISLSNGQTEAFRHHMVIYREEKVMQMQLWIVLLSVSTVPSCVRSKLQSKIKQYISFVLVVEQSAWLLDYKTLISVVTWWVWN